MDETNGNTFLPDDDIEEEIEILDSEDLPPNEESSDEEVNDCQPIESSSETHISGEETAEESVDDSIVVFSQHSDAVLCCALNGSNTLVVSGGADDCAYVWNVSDGQLLFKCDAHNDSVICAAFNHSDAYIATGDMNGLIQVWKADGEMVFRYEVDELNWLLWHPTVNNVLLAGTASGDAWLLKVTGDFNCKTLRSVGVTNTAAKFLNNGNNVVMGYEDGSIRIWDIKTTSIVSTITGFNGHKGSVTSIDCSVDSGLIGTGSVDSTAKLINSKNGRLVASFQCGQSDGQSDGQSSDSVESVCFGSALSLFATATLSGLIEIWDISSQLRRHSCPQSDGICKLLWPNNQYLLYAAGLDGTLRVVDGRSGRLETTIRGHKHHILDCCLANNSAFIVTASEDTTCRVFPIS